jgi:hypothetical protein
MLGRHAKLAWFLSAVLSYAGPATAAPAPQRLGSPLTAPEARTGAWEMRLSSGKVLGLSIALSYNYVAVGLIRIVTYVRDGARSERTEWNTAEAGTLDWRGDRLRLRVAPSRAGDKAVDLDLIFDPRTSRWRGRIRRPGFSGTVALGRPPARATGAPIGAWRSVPADHDEALCIHVARGEDGRLVAWFDEVALQSFGELAEDLHENRSGSIWRFRLGNGLAGDAYTGKLSADGSIFAGTSTHFGNGEYEAGRPAVPFVWRREPPAKSCSATPIS